MILPPKKCDTAKYGNRKYPLVLMWLVTRVEVAAGSVGHGMPARKNNGIYQLADGV